MNSQAEVLNPDIHYRAGFQAFFLSFCFFLLCNESLKDERIMIEHKMLPFRVVSSTLVGIDLTDHRVHFAGAHNYYVGRRR